MSSERGNADASPVSPIEAPNLSLFGALRRRWYLLVAGVIATAGLGAAAFALVPPTYTAKATVFLAPPSTNNAGDENNPFLGISGFQSFTDVVSRAVMTASTAEAVKAVDPSGSFLVARDLTTNAPLLLVTGNSATADGAKKVVTAVTKIVIPTVERLQNDQSVPASRMLTATVLSEDKEATAVVKSVMRAAIAAVGMGIFGSLAFIMLFDRFMMARQAKRNGVSLPLATGSAPAHAPMQPLTPMPVMDVLPEVVPEVVPQVVPQVVAEATVEVVRADEAERSDGPATADDLSTDTVLTASEFSTDAIEARARAAATAAAARAARPAVARPEDVRRQRRAETAARLGSGARRGT